ncbi:unnamed protein product [Ilex paraguariensis]|uniref:RING-type domain-containing protein n=1 Tax=Ilex paraguariensis TaxID=185542 RepID=A0ABC8R287_9AQUA
MGFCEILGKEIKAEKILNGHRDAVIEAYADAGTVNQNYASILLMLLRLRQACDHPLLVKGFNSESVGKISLDMVKKLPRDIAIDLLNFLEPSLVICLVCSDPPEDEVVTSCGHVFCYQCVSDYLTGDDNMCPAPECKAQLGPDSVFSKAILRSCIFDEPDKSPRSPSGFAEKSIVLQDEYSSSKIKAALQILESHCRSKDPSPEPFNLVRCNGNSTSLAKECSESQTNGPIKAIVFSQWTSMLDLLEISLNQSCKQFRRLDGTMSLASRDKAVKEFNSDPELEASSGARGTSGVALNRGAGLGETFTTLPITHSTPHPTS